MAEVAKDRPAGRGRLLSAASVVVVGVIFWLRQARPELGSKVWVLFLTVPLLYFLSAIAAQFRRAGGVTRGMANWAVGALFLILMMTVTLSGIAWGSTWPAFIVIAGVGGVIRAVAKD
jgi:hypothetical protein